MGLTKIQINNRDIDGYHDMTKGDISDEINMGIINSWEIDTPIRIFKEQEFEGYHRQSLEVIMEMVQQRFIKRLGDFLPVTEPHEFREHGITGQTGEYYRYKLKTNSDKNDYDIMDIPIEVFMRLMKHYIGEVARELIDYTPGIVDEDYYLRKRTSLYQLPQFLARTCMGQYYRKYNTTSRKVIDELEGYLDKEIHQTLCTGINLEDKGDGILRTFKKETR